ncbi:MAG TPA: hypothetical protein EYH56_02130 [Nanoarchaeota archaeon]|nr:hypothetical protein [Nanoarchaeota archaeon]
MELLFTLVEWLIYLAVFFIIAAVIIAVLPEDLARRNNLFYSLWKIGKNIHKNMEKQSKEWEKGAKLDINFNFSSFSSSIVEVLKSFEPETFSSEQELEKQLTQFLKGQGFQVERQINIGPKERIDLKVSDGFQTYYVEIKEINSKSTIDRAVGQVERYLQYISPYQLVFLALITKNVDIKDLDLIKQKGVEVVEIKTVAKKSNNNRKSKTINISIKV